MRSRTVAVIAAGGLIVAACGGGSDEAEESLPPITLATTTTSLAPFEPSDSAPATDASDVAPDSAPTTEPNEPAASNPPVTTTPPPEITTTLLTTTTTEPAPAGDFSLRADGLGAVSFGAAPDGAIAFVSSFLGEATADTGWVDPFTIGACGGTQLRQVTWGDLQLEFGDVSAVAEGRPHFYAYYYGKEGSQSATPPGLETEDGITVGSSVADLIGAYPGVEFRLGDEFMNDSFFVNENLTGRLSGLADPDQVEMVIGGIPCDS